MKRALFAFALAAVVVSVKPARADEFTISFTNTINGLGYSGSGIFTADPLGGGEYQITGVVSGSVTDYTGLTKGTFSIVGVNNDLFADNLLSYPAGTEGFFDYDGLTFSLSNGDDINLFTNENYDGSFTPVSIEQDANGDQFDEDVNETVTPYVAPTPEPGSLALLGTSVLGAAGLLRRRLMA